MNRLTGQLIFQGVICEEAAAGVWNDPKYRRCEATVKSCDAFSPVDLDEDLPQRFVLVLVRHRHPGSRQIQRVRHTLRCHTR